MNEGVFCSAVVPLSDVSSLKLILLLYVANIRLWSCEVSQSVMELDASWTLFALYHCAYLPAGQNLGIIVACLRFLSCRYYRLYVGCSCLCALPSRRLKNRPCPFAERLYARVVDILPDRWSNIVPLDYHVQALWYNTAGCVASDTVVSRFPVSLRCLQVLTNWICQVRPYKSLYLHHRPYKSSSYWKCTWAVIKAAHFSKSLTLDSSTHSLNFKIIRTYSEVMSKADNAFLHIRSLAAEISCKIMW